MKDISSGDDDRGLNGTSPHHDYLQKCQIFLRSVCHTTSDSFFVFNKAGTIKAVNPSVEAMFDSPAEDLMGQSIMGYIPSISLEEINSERASFIYIATGERSSGGSFPLEMVVTVFKHRGQRLYFALLHDMSRSNLPERRNGLEALSPRQRQVLRLVVDGNTSREIAEMLSISVKTVETHRAHILTKLKAKNVTELVRIALENKLV